MCTESLRNHIFLHRNGSSLWMGLLIIIIVFIFYISRFFLLLAWFHEHNWLILWVLWFQWYVVFWRWEGSWSIYWKTSALQRMLISPCNKRVYGTSMFSLSLILHSLSFGELNNVGIWCIFILILPKFGYHRNNNNNCIFQIDMW